MGKKPSQSETNFFYKNSTFPLTEKPLGFNVQGVASREQLKQAAVLLGRRGGLARSKAKVKAAQENGKKGGRPRKLKAS